MAWYRTGTVNVTTGSTTVAGIGTSWISGASVGEGFYGPDGRIYEISAIVSATQLTLGSPYQGSTQSNATYVIVPSQSYLRDLALQASTLVNDYASILSGIGIGKFDDGTLAAPGIRFTADENTGMRRVGADSLALVTGGSDRLSVSSSTVTFAANPTLSAGTANGVLYLNGSKVATSSSAGLTYDGSNLGVGSPAGTNARLFAYANDATLTTLVVRQDGAAPIQVWMAGGAELMRFNSTGLGIGTSSPATNLEVSGSAARARVSGTAGSVPQLQLSSSGVVAWSLRANNDGGSDFTIYQDATQRLKIDSSGNLGIGTSSPGARLHVSSNTGTLADLTGSLRITNQSFTAGTYAGVLFQTADTLNSFITSIRQDGFGGAIAFAVNNGTNSSSLVEAMRLNSSGNLGIGTSSPGCKLDVSAGVNTLAQQWQGAGTAFTLRLKSGNAALQNTPAYRLYLDYNNEAHTNGYIDFYRGGDGATGFLTFGTSGTERMRLDGLGNLGVGTSPGNYGTGYTTLAVNGSVAGVLDLAAGGVSQFRLFGNTFENRLQGATNAPMTFYTNNSERMRLDASGNLGIGTTSPTQRLDVSFNETTANRTNPVNVAAITATKSAGDAPYTGFGPALVFRSQSYNGTVYNGPRIRMAIGDDSINTTTGSSLAFDVTATKGAAPTQAAVIDPSGNLAVGIDSPSARLHVNAPAGVSFIASDVAMTASQVNIGVGVLNVGRPFIGTSTNSNPLEIGTRAATDTIFVTGGTEKMRLTSGGELLVGSTNSSIGKFVVRGVETSNYNTLSLGNGTDFQSLDVMCGRALTNGTVAGVASIRVMTLRSSGALAGDLAFATGNEERARITSGGDFGIGNTNPLYRLTVDKDTTSALAFFTNSNASAPNGLYVDFSASSPNNATQYFLYCEDSTAQRATIRSNGGLANYSGNDVNLSDRREKTNFAPAKSYLDTICAIPVQTFEYIDQSPDDPGLTLGVVAQDVQAVAPELVMESNWGTEDNPKMRLSIYQTDLQYALMKCIQELKAQNDELRARVAALESQP